MDRANVDSLENVRRQTLNLEFLYGSGSVGEPCLYGVDDSAKLLLGLNDAGRPKDLQRNSQGIAIIADPRNDSHLLASQMQVLFIKFHNRIGDLVVAQRTGLAVPRATLNDIMSRLGGRPGGSRHKIFGRDPAELLVEVPSHEIPPERDRVVLPSDLVLTMDFVERAITARTIEFHNTGDADHALQAIHTLRALRGRLDRERHEWCIIGRASSRRPS